MQDWAMEADLADAEERAAEREVQLNTLRRAAQAAIDAVLASGVKQSPQAVIALGALQHELNNLANDSDEGTD
jgi:hypothetical protein